MNFVIYNSKLPMDQHESLYLSLVENGYRGPVDSKEEEELKNMLQYMRDHNASVAETKNEEPCGLLIEAIMSSRGKYSKEFVVWFLCEQIDRGCIWVKNIIYIIKLYNIFDPDSSYSLSEIGLLNTIIYAIEVYLNSDMYDNYHTYLNIDICDTTFEETMIFLKDIIDCGGQMTVDFFDIYNNLFFCFRYSERSLPCRWISKESDPKDERLSLSQNSFFDHSSYALPTMIETTYRMFKYPDLYDEKTKNKLYMEHHACEKLKNKYRSMVLFYTKLFGGEYRKIDPKITRENLPSDIVEYLLTFLGMNELDCDLRNGRF